MRVSTAAMALIRRESGGGPEWLTQWNEGWQAFHLVGGHRKEGESFRECCARELNEELGLCEGADVRLGGAPAAHLEYIAYSRSAGVETAYTVELFDAELLTDAARRKVAAEPSNRWIGEREVRAGQCGDGRRVSTTMRLLLGRAGILGASPPTPYPFPRAEPAEGGQRPQEPGDGPRPSDGSITPPPVQRGGGD